MQAMMEAATEAANDIARLLALQIGEVSGKGEFEGYAVLWGEPDRYETIIIKGAFDAVLAEYAASKLYPPLVWEHTPGDVIGSVRLESDDKGLRVYGKLNLDDERGKWGYERITESQFYLSFWAGAAVSGKLTDDEGRTVYTRMLYVREISIVADPGSQLAAIDVVRSQHKAEIETAEKAGYEKGLTDGRAAAEADGVNAAALAMLKSWAGPAS